MASVLQPVHLLFVYVSFGFSVNLNRCHSRGEQDPSVQYEVQRRRVEFTARGLRDYVSAQMFRSVTGKGSAGNCILKACFISFNERMSMLLLEQQRLWAVDGWGAWRGAEAAEVTHLVQRRLHVLQHPKHCTQARKLVCTLENKKTNVWPQRATFRECEFGCQLGHLVFCLSLSYGTRRTLVLDSRGWRYHARGWGEVFQPLSQNCTYSNEQNLSVGDAKVLTVPTLNSFENVTVQYLPPTIPRDLVDRIVCFTGDPAAWWIGQLLAYILRPREHLAAAIARTKHRIHYHKPIVGLHIRRTDKIELREMIFHPIEEYMFFAEYYYWTSQDLMVNTSARRVYLATEDPQVLSEARRKYPLVQFLGDPAALQPAGEMRVRSQPSGLPPLLTDITLLAAADFVVCTHSSNICRVTYALMQSGAPEDAAGGLHSLDQQFRLDAWRWPHRSAVSYHRPLTDTEIDLMPGDAILNVDPGNTWEGIGSGFNQRTRQRGEFPWFKTRDILRVHSFPTYDEVPQCSRRAGRTPLPAPPTTPPQGAPMGSWEADDVSAPTHYPDLYYNSYELTVHLAL